MLFLLSLDINQSLGRFGIDELSQQDRMELLVSNFHPSEYNRLDIKNLSGEFREMCQWSSIDCNDEKDVIGIGWFSKLRQGGTIDFTFLPPTLERIGMGICKLHGTLACGSLPQPLHIFALFNNYLSGSLNLPALPRKMRTMLLWKNNFSGEIDLSRLPPELYELSLENNALTGNLDLLRLPRSLARLALGENLFTGEVTVIPRLDCEISLDCNQGIRVVDVNGDVVHHPAIFY